MDPVLSFLRSLVTEVSAFVLIISLAEIGKGLSIICQGRRIVFFLLSPVIVLGFLARILKAIMLY